MSRIQSVMGLDRLDMTYGRSRGYSLVIHRLDMTYGRSRGYSLVMDRLDMTYGGGYNLDRHDIWEV